MLAFCKGMLRGNKRVKDGKEQRYYTVLYWGEINDNQQAAWRKTQEVFDEQQHPRDPFPNSKCSGDL